MCFIHQIIPAEHAVTVFSLLSTVLILVVAYLITKTFGRNLSNTEWFVFLWLSYDALVHTFLEGTFVYFSTNGRTVETSSSIFAELWKEYAKADTRWGNADATVVSLEILTVFFDTYLCIVVMYAMVRNKVYRHYAQIVLCVCELYGGWMTFCPEWLTGNVNLNKENSAMHLWVYLIFFNGVWVVVPLLLMYQSWNVINEALQKVPYGVSSPRMARRSSTKKMKSP